MDNITLTAKSPLGGLDTTNGRCRLREVTDISIVSAAMPAGSEKKTMTALKKAYGLAAPDGRMSTVSDKGRALMATPDQLLIVLNEAGGLHAKNVREALGGTVYTTDQTDNLVALEVSGAGAIDALERICPIDLHDSTFPVGSYARTVMEHLGATIIRTGDDSYLLMSASSSAKSFAHAVQQSMDYTA